jgi:hypothetical protein
VTALLIILISGALVGAATYRLLDYFLNCWFGEQSFNLHTRK